jgi:hypothetical protein
VVLDVTFALLTRGDTEANVKSATLVPHRFRSSRSFVPAIPDMNFGKCEATGNFVLVPQALRPQTVLQLPSWFRKPVDDNRDFIPVRNVHAGVRCSARLAA